MIAVKEVYTAQELAALSGITRQGIDYRVKNEQWPREPRKGRGGGFCYPYATLPQDMQIAIRTAEERNALAACEGFMAPAALAQNAQVNALGNALLTDQRRYKALAKADIVQLYITWQRKYGFTTKQKSAFVEAYLGGVWPKLLQEFGPQLSWKSLERWKNQQAEAGTVLALADKRGLALKGRTTLTEQHRIIILGHVLNPNAPKIAQAARRIQERCKNEGLYVPSDATIRRFVQAYTQECFDEWTLWREGKKAWNDKCAISLLRDWNLVEVGDIVIADGHTLNFETLDPETGKPKRMTLLLFYDGASNCPLGWEIMRTENVACISAAFRRACIVLGKIPRIIYIDNGKAFRAKFFEGIPDLQQAGILGLYASLGCEVIHAWPYHGQSKPIERFFGTFHDMEVFVPSYTGNSIDAKPARMKRGELLHRKLYEKMGGRPLTLEETHTAIAQWFCEYASRPQFRTHLAGRTPAEAFRAGVGPGIDVSRLTLMMMAKTIKTINKDGIRHQGKLFWHEALASRRHAVVVRYDEQLSPHTILVYTQDGEFICEARDREYYKIASGLHPAARILGTAEQQQTLADAIDLKRGQEKLAGANMKTMLESVVKPEMALRQAALAASTDTAPVQPEKRLSLAVQKQQPAMSEAEIAVIEAAKAQARAIFDTNLAQENEYTPAAFKRFKDELEKYDYLFRIAHESNIPLVAQDAAWMQHFEGTQEYQRNYKRRYDQLLELYAFRTRQAAIAS
ncbi:Mu transposase C-terminal domain-containing protein [Desulfovibrio cuneatus]|uniref:Mu transposase C-terminal domain-containing protein n=1 Tax=Desulfovibrio cuneatus TaxID=159728 RepID=UPI0003FCEEEF|nr:Mu transposase C-terminal domain-containing protein [Desulfovibrio cuneatus]